MSTENDKVKDLPRHSVPKKLIRKPAIVRKQSSAVIDQSALQKIHNESERRLSTLDNNTTFERARRATVRISAQEEASIHGQFLEKVRQNSVTNKKVDVVATTKNIASQFEAVCESDLLTESLNAVINRIGHGNAHFDTNDLYEYIRQVFNKSKFEIDKLVNILKERNDSAHTLQIMLESANLKRKPKSSAFCSMTLKKLYEPLHFSLCNSNNTVLSTLCGSQSPLWDATLSLPLETTKSYSLVVGVWETKQNASMATVNDGKKCMGCVEITDLSSQQTSDELQWWELKSHKKTNRSKNKGKIHLAVKHNAEIGRHVHAVMVHAGMLSKFLSKDYPELGSLSGTAAHILELQKIQQKLVMDEFRFADWLVRYELYLKTNNHFELLHRVLVLFLDCMNKTKFQLSDDQLRQTWKTFTDFQSKYIAKIRNLNTLYPYTTETSVLNVKFLTKCYLSITQCSQYTNTHPDVLKQSKTDLHEAFEENTTKWVEMVTSSFLLKEGEDLVVLVDNIKSIRNMTEAVRIELRNESAVYKPALESTPYLEILIYHINEKVSNGVVGIIAKVIPHVRATLDAEREATNSDGDILNDCLGLYVSVASLKKLCNDLRPGSDIALNLFHSWFYNVIELWLQMVQAINRMRVDKSVNLFDELERVDMHVPYSTSVVDVMTMDHQLCEIIDIFDFPDDKSRFRVTEKLTKQILESSEQLCETLFKKGKNVLDKGTKKFGENKVSRDELMKTALVVCSSMEKVVEYLQTIPELLRWKLISDKNNLKKLRLKIEESSENVRKVLLDWMSYTAEQMTEPKFIETWKNFITGCHKNDEYAQELIPEMIFEEMNTVYSSVDMAVYKAYLRVLWDRVVLPQFDRHLQSKPIKIQTYYEPMKDCLEILADSFVKDIDDKEHVKNKHFYKTKYILENLTIPLEDLMFRYFTREMIQESKQESDLGYLTVNAVKLRQGDKIIVQTTVIRCSALPTMDTLGTCDAIVKVSPQPKRTPLFYHIKPMKTKAIPNDLDPVFNQEFQFSYPGCETEMREGSCIQYTIWDQDKYSSNDFIGEVLIDLAEIPYNEPAEFKRHLSLPDLESLTYEAISHRRSYENKAEKFVIERKKLVNEDGDNYVTKRESTYAIFKELSQRLRLSSMSSLTSLTSIG